MEFTLQGKKISIYGEGQAGVPVIYLNMVDGEGSAVWEQCRWQRAAGHVQEGRMLILRF